MSGRRTQQPTKPPPPLSGVHELVQQEAKALTAGGGRRIEVVDERTVRVVNFPD